jgi:hypothetical protein
MATRRNPGKKRNDREYLIRKKLPVGDGGDTGHGYAVVSYNVLERNNLFSLSLLFGYANVFFPRAQPVPGWND